jgi:hypothetical protein
MAILRATLRNVNRQTDNILRDGKCLKSLDLAVVTAAEVLIALKKLREDEGTDIAVARLLHVQSNHVPRMLEKAPDDFHPQTATCIRIAAAIDRPARDVLEALGQQDVADAIEECYRERPVQPKQPSITLPREDQAHLAQELQRLPDPIKEALGALVHALAAEPRARRRKSTGTRPAIRAGKEDVSDLLQVESDLEPSDAERPAHRPGTRAGGASKHKP